MHGIYHYVPHYHSSMFQVIQITFISFSLEYDSHCDYDGVRLYNDEELVSTECNDLPADFTSSGGRARVEFYSDGSVTKTGFLATVTFVDVIPPTTAPPPPPPPPPTAPPPPPPTTTAPPPPPGTCGPPPGPCPNITKVTRLGHISNEVIIRVVQ